MKAVISLLTFFILFSSSGCKRNSIPQPPETETAEERANRYDDGELSSDGAPVLLTFERTGCFGKCPTFRATVYANGRSIYEGERNTDKIGRYKAELAEDQVKTIIRKARAIGFFKLASEYPEEAKNRIVDLPSTITFLSLDNQQKRIINHNYQTPQQLTDLENTIEEVLNSVEWVKIND